MAKPGDWKRLWGVPLVASCSQTGGVMTLSASRLSVVVATLWSYFPSALWYRFCTDSFPHHLPSFFFSIAHQTHKRRSSPDTKHARQEMGDWQNNGCGVLAPREEKAVVARSFAFFVLIFRGKWWYVGIVVALDSVPIGQKQGQRTSNLLRYDPSRRRIQKYSRPGNKKYRTRGGRKVRQ